MLSGGRGERKSALKNGTGGKMKKEEEERKENH